MQNITLQISKEVMQAELNAVEGRMAISLDSLKVQFTMQLEFMQAMQDMTSAKLLELQSQIDSIALRLPPNPRPTQVDVLKGATSSTPSEMQVQHPQPEPEAEMPTVLPIHTGVPMPVSLDGNKDAMTRVEVPSDRSISAKITESDQTQDTIELRESMWDASILLGIEELGTLNSSIGGVALLLNMIVQFLFAMIVILALWQHTDRVTNETTEQYQSWRLTIAHQFQYMDQLSGQSLAARVCAGDDGIELSEGQQSICAPMLESRLYMDADVYVHMRALQRVHMCLYVSSQIHMACKICRS